MGIARNLAISLGGLVVIGGLIYVFRDKLASGVGTIGQTVGEAVGFGIGKIPSGILGGVTGGLLGEEKPRVYSNDGTYYQGGIVDWFANLGNLFGGQSTPNPTGTGASSDTSGTGAGSGTQQTSNEERTSKTPEQQKIYTYSIKSTSLRTTSQTGFGQKSSRGTTYTKPAYGNITNPNPIIGIYDLTKTKFGEQLPLSQSAVDYYKKIGVGLKRVGSA